MKFPLIAANWKSNLTYKDAENWIKFFINKELKDSTLIVFPPFPFLGEVGYFIEENRLPFIVGSQDVSPFKEGSFTGEVNAAQMKDFAEIVLIGHSERRKNFNETNEVINQKIDRVNETSLKIILCISELSQLESIPQTQDLIVAYEPLSAIGTGNPEDPSSVREMVKKIKNIMDVKVIYGGSVNAENVSSYLEDGMIDGVLVGKESLDPQSFLDIINNAI